MKQQRVIPSMGKQFFMTLLPDGYWLEVIPEK